MVIRSASHTDMLKIAPLVIDFRRELSQLRRKKSSISLDDAKKELEEYFNKNYPIFIAENDTKETSVT